MTLKELEDPRISREKGRSTRSLTLENSLWKTDYTTDVVVVMMIMMINLTSRS
jgi:hypothetical protein